MKLLKLVPFLTILAFASCKDDEEKTVDLLTDSKGWQLTALTVDPAFVDPFTGTSITDFYAQSEACEKDDVVFFNDPNQLVTDEGATKCDPTDPQSTTGTWVLSADGKVVTVVDADGYTQSWTIESISKSKMEVSYVENFGVNYTFSGTFEHP